MTLKEETFELDGIEYTCDSYTYEDGTIRHRMIGMTTQGSRSGYFYSFKDDNEMTHAMEVQAVSYKLSKYDQNPGAHP